MTFKLTSAQRRTLAKENAKWPHQLHPVPREAWPSDHPSLLEVWRSRGFLVQVLTEKHGHIRMTVCRTMQRGDGWIADITWDELMQLKRECGRGDQDALELFPADRDIVNVANMRHLFFPPTPVLFKWVGGE